MQSLLPCLPAADVHVSHAFPSVSFAQARGPECFDWQYYLQQNQDLKCVGDTRRVLRLFAGSRCPCGLLPLLEQLGKLA